MVRKAIRRVITNPTESFELDDGEQVIDSISQPYTDNYQVLILTEEPFECGEETSSGDPCQRSVSGPEEICSLHEEE